MSPQPPASSPQQEGHAAYLTVDEAAALARCHPRTIRRAVHSGRLRAFRPAGRMLLADPDVRAWIEAHTAAPASPPGRGGTHRQRRSQAGSLAALREIERSVR